MHLWILDANKRISSGYGIYFSVVIAELQQSILFQLRQYRRSSFSLKWFHEYLRKVILVLAFRTFWILVYPVSHRLNQLGIYTSEFNVSKLLLSMLTASKQPRLDKLIEDADPINHSIVDLTDIIFPVEFQGLVIFSCNGFVVSHVAVAVYRRI